MGSRSRSRGRCAKVAVRAACEALESRTLLAATVFPDPVIVRQWGGGWDFKKNVSPGIPSTFGGATSAPGALPGYTLQFAGETETIPVESISWGGVAPQPAPNKPFDPTKVALDAFTLTVDAGPYT